MELHFTVWYGENERTAITLHNVPSLKDAIELVTQQFNDANIIVDKIEIVHMEATMIARDTGTVNASLLVTDV